MEIKNTFVQGRMNKDIDERLLPQGEYPNAENIRVIDNGEGNLGAIENDLGNVKISNFTLTNAKTIGKIADAANQKIYYFNTSTEKDLVVEYDEKTNTTSIVLESSKPNGVLNFNSNYLITGVNKIINEESGKDLLAWTDNFNPPRVVNIERAKTYGANNFVEEDISVIKNPPVFAPTLTPTYSEDLSENNLDNKFLAFSYRFKYLDGGYSVFSPFSYYYFIPNKFSVDYYVLENSAMVNKFNAVKIAFNTGDKRVIEVELLVKASNSNTVYIVERFNKEEELWLNNVTKDFTFSNSKLYMALDKNQLTRLYDNVPLLAASQDLVGNRLIYGNYLENYDLVDLTGERVGIDFNASIISKELVGEDLDTTISTIGTPATGNIMTVDLTGKSLVKGATISLNLLLNEQTYEDGNFQTSAPFVLEEDYNNVSELATSPTFINFVEVILSNIFEQTYTVSPSGVPADSVVQNYVGFKIQSYTANTFKISAPRFDYLIANTPPAETSYWGFKSAGTIAYYSLDSSSSSLKSNRSYELGIIYMDKSGRSSTVLTSTDNTINIPHTKAISKNKFKVNILNKPPYWADRYKLAVKQNKQRYYEIYASIFYEDGAFRWIKLEGTNKDKVKVNDNLVIKSDLKGFVPKLRKVRVLEVVDQKEDFLIDNKDSNGENIIEQSGLYMKIKSPFDVDMDYKEDSFQNYPAKYIDNTGDAFIMALGEFSTYDEVTGTWTDIPITQGSQITFRFSNTKGGSSGGDERIDKTFTAGANYDSIESWFNTEHTLGELDPFNKFGTGWIRGTLVTTATIFGAFLAINPDPTKGLFLIVRNVLNGNGQHPSRMRGDIIINKSSGLLIFETEPDDNPTELYFESSEVFKIEDGFHTGNIQNQTLTDEAIVSLEYYNCFTFGNGSEANSYRGAFNTNWVNMDLKPTSTTISEYKSNRRFADFTYSEVYNEGTSVNGLNEFNLSKANFKDDLEKKYGSIQKIWARDTDILVCQEDKIGYVRYGKATLYNADGSSGNVGRIQDVLGDYIPYTGEYGISKNPESFATNANRVYFMDSKRGVPLRLGGDGLFEINEGMTNYFKDISSERLYEKKAGEYDPFLNQYNLSPELSRTLTHDEKASGWTSFHTFKPDMMVGMNNKFYSFTNGNMYLHHQNNRNQYYGVNNKSKVSSIVNLEPSTIKEMLALNLEGTHPWDVIIQAYINSPENTITSSIKAVEFVKKEGYWYAHTRRSEDQTRFDSQSTYGIGRVTLISGNSITFQGGNSSLCVGDKLVKGSDLTILGVITDIQGQVITLDSPTTLVANDFILGMKDSRVEGASLRGYTFRVDMEIESTNKVELFAINSEVVKSFSK